MATRPVLKSLKGGYTVSPTTKPHTKPTMNHTMKLSSLKGGSSLAKPLAGGSKTKKASGEKKSKKSNKSKKPMPKGYAYCMNPKCRKQVKMLTEKSKTTKNGRTLLYGEGACGHTVYRFA